MSWRFKNIEDFLRRKLSQLDSNPVNDWDIFEAKLNRALFYRDLRQFSIAGLTAVMLSFWVINNYQLPLKPFIQHKTEFAADEPVLNKAYLQEQSSKSTKALAGIGLKAGPDTHTQNIKSAAVEKPVSLVGNSLTDSRKELKTAVKAEAPADLTATGTKANQAGSSSVSENPVDNTKASISVSANAESASEAIVMEEQSLINLPFLEAPYRSGNEGNLNLQEQKVNVFALENALKHITAGELILIKTNFVPPVRNEPYVSPLQPTNPWSYSVNVYPNFSFRKFEVDQNKLKLLHRDFIDAMEVSERTGFALNVGLEISRRIGKITYLNSGVEYISTKTETNFDFSKFRDAVVDGSTGEILSYKLRNAPQRVTLNDYNQYHYLNIPLSISYQPWASDHVRVNIEGGGSIMYFMEAQGKTLDYKTLDIVELADQDYKNYIGSLFVKIGLQYYVSPSINVGFEPTLMYFTNTIYSDDYPFYVIPYSAGMNLNLQVKLN